MSNVIKNFKNFVYTYIASFEEIEQGKLLGDYVSLHNTDISEIYSPSPLLHKRRESHPRN
ncbi:MAG: hypothetical protein CL748_01450 [Chloroflexi bacterium]|nr:hypothetical protein [Chloroflexota bacterium]